MTPLLGRYHGPIYAILRIMTGIMFAMHGTQKLLGWPPSGRPGPGPAFPALPWFAGVIEIVCGTLIAIGLVTSLAAFLASGTMAAAYFIGHFPNGFWPILNRGELAAVYCFLFLFFAAYGSGPFSVDAAMRRGRAAPHET
ncbi:MAG TPA: DoxX family protein [Thermoanaerobaculia bacterium]|nr:DoxX family protein [Thermoanaerobaculia bacterium]